MKRIELVVDNILDNSNAPSYRLFVKQTLKPTERAVKIQLLHSHMNLLPTNVEEHGRIFYQDLCVMKTFYQGKLTPTDYCRQLKRQAPVRTRGNQLKNLEHFICNAYFPKNRNNSSNVYFSLHI